MKKTKQFISILLALIMIISIIPMSSISASAEDIPTSGTCGDNLTWEYDEESGVMYISGTGTMYDYYMNRPWEDFADEVYFVNIGDEVTTISNYAFYGFSSLNSIVLGESITTIGVGAFESSALISVTIPVSVVSIGIGAFWDNSYLTDIYYCGTEEQWNAITIGSDNEPLYFAQIHFQEETVNPSGTCGENANWEFDPETGTLTVSGTGAMQDYYTSDSPWKSYKNSIKAIIIEEGITKIGQYAFEDCGNCANLKLPDSLTETALGAFMSCWFSDIEWGNGLKTIGPRTFQSCSFANNDLVIPNGVTTMGNNAFSYCNIRSVRIPDSLTVIPEEAFRGCSFLEKVFFPDTLVEIEENAFLDLYLFTDVYYAGSAQHRSETLTIDYGFDFMGNYDLQTATWHYDCTAEHTHNYIGENITPPTCCENGFTEYICSVCGDFYFADEVVFVESETDPYEGHTIRRLSAKEPTITEPGYTEKVYCLNCDKVFADRVEIPATGTTANGTCGENVIWGYNEDTGMLTISGTGAMENYTYNNRPWEKYADEVSSVVIGDNVTTIADYAFFNFLSLNSIVIGNSVTTIGNSAFESADLFSVTIPVSVVSIGYAAFWGNTHLTDVYYDGSEEQWNAITMGQMNESLLDAMIHIKGPVVNPTGSCGENVTWEFNKYTHILTISGTGAMSNFSAFDRPFVEYRESIKKVVICDGVTTIGSEAFINCYYLKSITIPNSVTSIGNMAFQCCYSLTDLKIPDSVTTIGYSAFLSCASLTSVKIPNGVTSIRDSVFNSCDSLKSVTIPDSVTKIGSSAFCQCYSLTDVAIPENVTAIDNYAFERCKKLTKIIIPESVTTIGNEAFSGCVSLTSITIPDSVTTMGDYVLLGCDSLTNIEVSEDNIVYSSTDGVLFNKDKTTLIQYPIGNDRTSYTVPDSVISIANYAFFDGDSLTNITIPASVTTIGYNTFGNCDSLADVYYYGTEEQWNNISISNSNELLLNATIHYNYVPPFTGIKGDYFYKDGVMQKAYQLVEFEGNYYFINDSHKLAKNKRIYLSQKFVEGTPLAVGYYDFDADGKLLLKNGPIGDYFYKGGVMQRAYQLVEFEGNYYFINDGNKIAKNTRIYLSQIFVEGTDLKVGYYDFDADGKLLLKNGPEGDYFYKDGIRLNAYQLVEYNGDYYFINDAHKLAKNKRIYLSQGFVEGTDLKVGYYDFDAEGKLVLKNGPIGDYFYKDGVMQKAYQLVEYEGNYYFINDSHKLAKNKRIYLSQVFVEGTDLKVGYYEFDADGKMIVE